MSSLRVQSRSSLLNAALFGLLGRPVEGLPQVRTAHGQYTEHALPFFCEEIAKVTWGFDTISARCDMCCAARFCSFKSKEQATSSSVAASQNLHILLASLYLTVASAVV
ncbi:hypothetical protein DOTSEDRAFT_44984 [Dothistroma septosporum NZE10]|uniref:Uncharacterized protein n=1 Tax=Dothistroma septosporum (strain NZE10 / CBS 128990) TaxID=675120 RepID=M2XK89_DOTSN|nr:hypothetical protein DOTSEDRAFT_44984 [Dothistroma septosporum NZE10]